MEGWSDALNIGHPEIDRQHRALIEHLHMIVREIVGEDEATIAARAPVVSRFLIEHFTTHFLSEESFMEATHYPRLDEHRREHRDFFDRINDAVKRVEVEKNAVAVLVLIAVAASWVGHIMSADVAFAEYAHDRAQGRV